VVVVGGGIAGLAAAVGLVERGVEVVLLEREAQLGGRVSGWPTTLRDGSPVTMSRGFHAFFRQYYNLRALLRRADPLLEALTPLPDYPLRDGRGRTDTFADLPRTPPWNALAFVARSPTFTWRDLLRVDPRAALPLLDAGVPDVYHRLDEVDAVTFLERIRFPHAARHLAFEVFSRSFFADPQQLSAAELATMFHIYFLGSAEGLVFDVPADPFPHALWDPLARYLARRGARLRTSAEVTVIEPGGPRRFLVHLRPAGGGTETEVADAVVLAVDVGGLRRLVDASPDLGTEPWRATIRRLSTAPPFLVLRLWLDRPVRHDRPGFLGTSGHGPLDNVSVLERYEHEARAWAARRRGSVVELHAYALPDNVDPQWVRAELVHQLHRVYPETRSAGIVDERAELRADCPLFPPGSFRHRPPVVTPDPYLVLAGDLTRVDLPVALMERAATSGFLAANTLLHRWGIRGHLLWSVPTRGRLALGRFLVGRYARLDAVGRDGTSGRAGAADEVQPGQRPVLRSS